MYMISVAIRKMVVLANQGYEYDTSNDEEVILSKNGSKVSIDKYGRVVFEAGDGGEKL